MIHFSRNDVAQMAGRIYFNRGMDYFRANKSVIKSSEMISETHMVISALTRGTTNYVQSISVTENSGRVNISGRCSCPVGSDCKHVVSSALTFISQYERPVIHEKSLKSDADRWLESLQKSLEPEDEKKSILIYRISPSPYPGKMQLVFYRSRLLQKGGFGKQKRLEYHQLMNSFAQKDFLTQNDRDILELFGALESRVTRLVYIEGELGGLLLEKIIKSGHAYWHGNRNTPLSWSDTLACDLVWKDEKEGGYRLSFDFPKSIELLVTEPISYVDTKSHKVGTLNIEGIGPRQLELLLKAPLLKKEDLGSFAVKAVETLPALPIPKEVDIKVIATQPLAKLKLFGAQEEDKVQHKIHLSFFYDGVEISGIDTHKRVLQKVDAWLVQVERDIEAEQNFKNVLALYGFALDESSKSLEYLPTASGQKMIDIWRHFLLEKMESLKESGWSVEVDSSFLYRFREGGEVHIDVQEKQNWFDVGIELEVGGSRLNLVEMTSTLLGSIDDFNNIPDQISLEIEENHFVTVASEQFAPILKTLLALYKGDRTERLNIEQYEAHLLPKAGASLIMSGSGAKRITTLKRELENFDGIEKAAVPKGLQATLRDYQLEGLNWLGFLEKFSFGGILADDMGLGKTIQTLAHLQGMKEQGKLIQPVLIVAPTSLLGNWRNEAKQFTPDLTLLIHHGTKRNKKLESIDVDIIITTYALVSRDIKLFEKMNFSYLIMDEAQNIKNHTSKAHGAIKQISASSALALSGTPMENHLGEMWAIFDAVMPNFLGDYKSFKSFYQTPIEKEHDQQRQQLLRERIAPFMLRRTKEKVATELPPKTVMTRSVAFEGSQAKLYEGIRISMEKKVREVIAEKGLGRSHITILDALLKLRQVCCDPRLVPLAEAQKVKESAKLEMLLELVEELLEEGRRILIFSQFTSMLAIIEEALMQRDVPLAKLTGSTQNREKVIERFTGGEAHVFLISLKAGGVGLNLTEADTVIHYDPWWNPAAEDQATDRAYRIGQEKPVFVYKLIIEDSVEEKILALQQQKKQLSNALFSEKEEGVAVLDAESLLQLFS